MKNTFLAMISILSFCSFVHAETYDQKKLFSGSIQFPFKMDFDLCLFYKGEKLTVEKHSMMPLVEFSFVDSKDIHTVYLVITSAATCCTEAANTLQSLCVAPDNQYICYKFQAKRTVSDNHQELLTWDINEHILAQSIIPQNSLIFLFDPKLISGLKIESWKPENVFRIVPTILINPQATAQELQRSMIISRLAALDVDALHAKTVPTASANAILTVMQ